jgi:4-amino-4-deoxy-L-arabinose transferase-like glycosyltransferase
MSVVNDFLARKEECAGKDLAVLLIVFGLSFFVLLGHLPLLEPDEARYAEIPREMLVRGDFVTPQLNYLKYFEKPPLHYWQNALSLSLFGNTEFAARFPSALQGLGTILLIYLTGSRLFGRRAGFCGAAILGSSLNFLVLGRMNSIDMTLTFHMSATLCFFLLATREGEKRKSLYYHLFYVFSALTVLAKGLIGIVLPGGIIFFYLLLTRKWKLLHEMKPWTGIPLFLAVCAPWFVLVSLKNPEFPRFFFIHEHFQRFLTKVHGRYEPAWFFIPVLLGGMVPWTFFLFGTVRDLVRDRGKRMLFLLLWAGVIFLFFSASSSKLIPYILPVFPAIALLVGFSLSRGMEANDRLTRLQFLAAAIFLALAGVGIILYPLVVGKARIDFAEALPTGIIFLAGGMVSLPVLFKGRLESVFAVFCLSACLTGIVSPPAIFARSVEKKSTRELAPVIRERFRDVPLVSYGYYRQDLPFYTGRRVIVVGTSGELEFGRLREKQQGWFLDPVTFCRLWDSPTAMAVLMSRADLAVFQPVVKTKATMAASWGDTVLVTNRR